MKVILMAVNMALTIGSHTMVLTDVPCRDHFIIYLYKDTPDIGLKEGQVLKGDKVLFDGCWYEADGKVFFIDTEGDLLVPVMPKDAFKLVP